MNEGGGPNVVWDMGGILFRYFTEVLLDMGAERGWALDGMPIGPTGQVPDPDYVRMQEGDIDEPRYRRIVVERLRAVGVDGDPTRAIDWSRHRRPGTWDAIGRIHAAGHRQAVLTNDASRWLGPRWWESWESGTWFDAVVDVEEVGVRKPAAAPYLAAAEALGVDPEPCLFVDDMPVNCRGAEAVGMSALWFDVRDPDGGVHRLIDRLGL
jgi:putative hydrolase of the HAD superfamily